MNTQPRVRARLAMFAAGVAITVAGSLVGAGVASAHHPDLVASSSCQGGVSYTATAWMPDGEYDPSQRTNTRIDITYQVNGSGPSIYVASGQFNQGNGYSFSGSFPFPSGAASVLITATAINEWGDQGPAGYTSQATAVQPCTEQPTTTVEETTTTAEETTTTEAATTTTEVGSEGPTTTVAGPTTTEVDSGGPTTTLVGGELPRTGNGDAGGSLFMVACGLLLMGGSIVMTVRRRPA